MVSKVVRPFSRSRIASIYSQYTLDDLKKNRGHFEQEVQGQLNEYFNSKGLKCEGFLLSQLRVVRSDGREEVVVEQPVIDERTPVYEQPHS